MSKHIQNALRSYDVNEFMSLVDCLRGAWGAPGRVDTEWLADSRGYVLRLTLHTRGCPENEALAKALVGNRLFATMWYAEWRRGGTYVFEITPSSLGYLTVSEYCKRVGITRQAVHQSKHKYRFVRVSEKISLVRPNENRNV